MYCSNCGAEAGGNFCAACGARLEAPTGPPPSASPCHDWVDEVVYETLLQAPGARQRIVRAGQRSQKRMSGEEFLALFDSVVPTGVSLEKLTVALLPIYERIGIKTGKNSHLTLTAPAGRVLLATLCALASQGYEIRHVEQMADGCVLTAFLPSTMWTNRGELVVSVHKAQGATHIHAATKIPGQLFDWGKSNQILQRLFDEVRRDLASQQRSDASPSRHVA